MASASQFIGSKISLISKSEIRYEGILYSLDVVEATISLAKGTCHPRSFLFLKVQNTNMLCGLFDCHVQSKSTQVIYCFIEYLQLNHSERRTVPRNDLSHPRTKFMNLLYFVGLTLRELML